ncbi:uncharacterized protein LOC143180155 [Calliopsis andreniformis]|uniref:uncharacterized protein LOC143180155 n=1 Tax=Calliopsis andreniformis TaxID=337506 RepID=UPI003FCE2B2E
MVTRKNCYSGSPTLEHLRLQVSLHMCSLTRQLNAASSKMLIIPSFGGSETANVQLLDAYRDLFVAFRRTIPFHQHGILIWRGLRSKLVKRSVESSAREEKRVKHAPAQFALSIPSATIFRRSGPLTFRLLGIVGQASGLI